MRKHYQQTSRSVYVCGPLTAAEIPSRAAAAERLQSETAAVERMLDAVLKERGKNALLYVRIYKVAHLFLSSGSYSNHPLDLLWLAVLALGAGSTVGLA